MRGIDLDKYFMGFAQHAATAATCNRLHVGAVITLEDKVISTGFNAAPYGKAQCTEVGCVTNEQGRCIATLHAEQSAIISAPVVSLKGATIYVTHYPCENCAKLIVASGIKRVVYLEPYTNPYSDHFLDLVITKQITMH